MALRIGRSRLPSLLAHFDMSQAELSRRLDVSEAFISRVISGKSKFSLEMAKNAAEILNCKIDDLHEWIPVRSLGRRKE